MALLQSCCGCVTIESGTMLVGIFSFLMSAMIFIGAIPSITNPKQTPSTLDDALFNIASAGGGGGNGNGGMGVESPGNTPRESPKDSLGGLRNDWQKHVFLPKVLHFIHVFITVLITVNMFASLVLILGVKSRNRLLLLPWIIWTGMTVSLCLVWIGLTLTPILTGDLLIIVLFSWAELCVVSHYQNLRDGVRESVEVRRAADSSGSFDAIYVTMTPRSDSEGGGVEVINHLTGQRSRHRSRRGRRSRSSRLRSRDSENDLPPAYPGRVGDVSDDDGDDAAAKDGDEEGVGDASPPPSYEQCFPGGTGEDEAVAAGQAAMSLSHPAPPEVSLTSGQCPHDAQANGGASTRNIIRETSSPTLGTLPP